MGHCPDAVFTLDRKGTIQWVNQQAEHYIGYKPSELMGGTFYPLVQAEDLDKSLRHYSLALAGELQRYSCGFFHKNGQAVVLDLTIFPMRARGRIIGVYGFAKDITEMARKDAELLKSAKSLCLAQEIARIGSWDYDIANNYVYCSDPLLAILGIGDCGDIVPNYENLLAMVLPEDQAAFDGRFRRVIREGDPMDLEYRIRKPDQTVMTAHVKAVAKHDERGRIVRVIGILSDITERLLSEHRLRASEEKFETIAGNLDVTIWSMDVATGRLVYLSPASEALTGYSTDRFMSGERTWASLIHPDDLPAYMERQSKLTQGEMLHHQYRIVHAGGEVKWIEDKVFPTLHADGRIMRLDGIVQDINERKRNEDKIHYYAYHDYLTGLPNRRMFDQRLEQLIGEHCAGDAGFALCYLDVDRFKFVNDTLGHEVGDALLCEAAERLSGLAGDASVYRIGGDEFAIILPLRQVQDPAAFGKAVIGRFEMPFLIRGYECHITTSIGISVFPDDGETLNQLRRNSDVALYRAKELGKNNAQLFNQSMSAELYRKFALENDLRKAIQREEFILHYQPRVDTLTGEVVGAEALIRWMHPVRGLIPPGEFIMLAEETGIIHEMSDWVVARVCRQLKAWQDRGCHPVPVSINLSAKTLIQADLVANIKRSLARYAVDPGLIEIEITEDSYINHEGAALPTIQSLRDMGLSIAIDDFGTGYSSIGYLKKFNVDTIKIDRSFIQGIEQSSEDATIVQSIILLGSGFRLKIVAEGVETREQWDMLRSLRCDYIQGYLFSKPLPAEQLVKLLNSDGRRIQP